MRNGLSSNVHSYYLDRLGKLERYCRQIYWSPSPIQRPCGLALTLIEWAKDLRARGDQLPARRDTTAIYLVTSRDGVHINDEWVYARQPLIPKEVAFD